MFLFQKKLCLHVVTGLWMTEQLIVPGFPLRLGDGAFHNFKFLCHQHLQALNLCQVPHHKRPLRIWLLMGLMDSVLFHQRI